MKLVICAKPEIVTVHAECPLSSYGQSSREGHILFLGFQPMNIDISYYRGRNKF